MIVPAWPQLVHYAVTLALLPSPGSLAYFPVNCYKLLLDYGPGQVDMPKVTISLVILQLFQSKWLRTVQ